tara:strand:+ start:58 stop:2049 length:1992 start_codon:yes stop_codon:yes gene_type:complete
MFSQSDDKEGKLKAREGAMKDKGKVEEKDTLNTDYYKIFYLDGRIDTVDTTLNIYKDYKFNFLREDSFDLISFANSAHTYNKLAYDFKDFSKPDIGARGKHFHYFEKEDIGYYNVPTPLTEIFAKSTYEQGQILDMLVSINLNPQYNFTIAHKGYKSLGKYLNTRSRGNQFRFSSNFKSKNDRSNWKLHFVSQNIFNQENGGLDPDSIYFFEQATEYFVVDNFGNQIIEEDGSYRMIEYDGYLDRSRLGPQIFAEGSLYSKRFFSDFNYALVKNKNQNLNTLALNYQFTHEYKKIQFKDQSKNLTFGDLDEIEEVNDLSRFIEQENILILSSNINKLGNFQFSYSITNWKNSFRIYENQSIDDLVFEIDPNQSNLSFDWKKIFEKYTFEFNLNKSSKNSFKSDFISFNIKGNPIKNVNFEISSSIIEKSPNFNFKFYRSAYENYNWFNDNLHDEKISNINFKLSYKDLLVLTADYNEIDNYTFFGETTNALTGETDTKRIAVVNQSENKINYFSLKLFSKVDIGKFSFVNTARYQKKEQEVPLGNLATLNVPEWVTRNTIMYSSDVFNKSLFIQTGITFNYFTKYFADYYNPLISEFVTQNYKEIGEFPRFDFFFNAKIQQTRVFIKVEHLNSSFTGYDYYSDPFSPFRDMSVRLGLVWNFFS